MPLTRDHHGHRSRAGLGGESKPMPRLVLRINPRARHHLVHPLFVESLMGKGIVSSEPAAWAGIPGAGRGVRRQPHLLGAERCGLHGPHHEVRWVRRRKRSARCWPSHRETGEGPLPPCSRAAVETACGPGDLTLHVFLAGSRRLYDPVSSRVGTRRPPCWGRGGPSGSAAVSRRGDQDNGCAVAWGIAIGRNHERDSRR